MNYRPQLVIAGFWTINCMWHVWSHLPVQVLRRAQGQWFVVGFGRWRILLDWPLEKSCQISARRKNSNRWNTWIQDVPGLNSSWRVVEKYANTSQDGRRNSNDVDSHWSVYMIWIFRKKRRQEDSKRWPGDCIQIHFALRLFIDLLQINEGHIRHQDGHQTPRVFCELGFSFSPRSIFLSGDMEETVC